MRYLKLFENFIDIQNTVMEIFIELKDLGYNIESSISNDKDTISVDIEVPKGKTLKDSDKEYILMFIDYMKDIWKGKHISINYEYRVLINERTRRLFTSTKLDINQFNGPVDGISIQITKREFK